MTTECSIPPQDRKEYPLFSGLLAYFPNALAEVSSLSKKGNDQHNPGEPMFWARWKSTDHADCLLRHLVDYDKEDTDGVLHATKVAWRALALLQELLEKKRGYPAPRGVRDRSEPEFVSHHFRATPVDPSALCHDYTTEEEEPAPEAKGTLYDWSKAPKWAMWAVSFSDKSVGLFENEPYITEDEFWSAPEGGNYKSVSNDADTPLMKEKRPPTPTRK